MAAAEAISRGNDAFVDENYDEALTCYNTAIDEDDTNVVAYVKRATVYNKLNKHDEAIMDTKTALSLDNKNKIAYFRQGQAYFALKDFGAAKLALRQAIALGETHSQCAQLLQQCHDALGTTEEGDVAQNAQAKPDSETSTESKVTAPSDKDTEPVALKPNRIAHDWYQTADMVIISVMLKKVDKSDVSVEFTSTSMSCSVKLHTGADYNLEIDTCHSIVPESSKYIVRATKIEIKMKKKNAIQWAALEGDGSDGSAVGVRMAVKPTTVANDKPIGYDTTKKWDKLASDAEKEEKETKLEGDAALNQLFKQIYGDANEETRRAMNKSFQESGGTVLSTNWAEIGAKKTEVKPPDGMVHKQY